MSWSGETTRTDKLERWQYQGIYKVGDVLADLCARTGCNLGISGEVVDLDITLSVKTSSPTVLLQTLRNALLFSGYYLTGSLKGNLSVYRDATFETSAFVDHLANVQLVPKSLLSVYREADRQKARLDSLEKVKPEKQTPTRWKLEFYSVAVSAARAYGLDASHPLITGRVGYNPLRKLHLMSFSLDYLSSNDSLFEYRTQEFDLDSTVKFSWGAQKQTLDKVIVESGVQTTSYTWRQYGINLVVTRYPSMSVDYVIRSPDESTIEGTATISQDSTLSVISRYTLYHDSESCFLPWSIFCKPSRTKEERYIILYMYKVQDTSTRHE